MPNNAPHQQIYAPLSQHITDSESEEEVLHNSGQQAISHNKFIQQRYLKQSLPPKTNMQSSRDMEPNKWMAVSNNNFQNFVPSDGEDTGGICPGTTNIELDNVAILQQDEPKKKMTLVRRCCFIGSIAFCLLTIVAFLWLLPCSEDRACPAPVDQIKTHNWLRDYEKIELKGVINVVEGLRGRSKNLVFGYRGDWVYPEFESNNKRRNGVISLIGSRGQVAWYDEMLTEPRTIDCSLIDIDLNGAKDCLILDEVGQLGCINPLSGQWMWHIQLPDSARNTFRHELLDFPLILPDINGDGVRDILFATSYDQTTRNQLVFVSGANGRTIGTPLNISDCQIIHKLQLDAKFMIRYNCMYENKELQKWQTLMELHFAATKRSMNLKNLEHPSNILQHKFFGQHKDTVSQRTISSVAGKQLMVENNGVCPEKCRVSVQLTEQKNGRETLIWNLTGDQMYGMVPARISFNNVGVAAKSVINGFVLKFWEWDPHKANETDYMIRSKRQKRSPTDPPAAPTQIRFLKETVVLIVFNSTDTKIENTSQSNVIQFCRGVGEQVCQPDLNYQENSLLIADLDRDGSQELVSYYSTFVKNVDGDGPTTWKLKTFVQLLRLEVELTKLFSIEIKN